jgi:hypothetical protein
MNNKVKQELLAIARKELGIKSLTAQNSDRTDFKEVHVNAVAKALEAAFILGTEHPPEDELFEQWRATRVATDNLQAIVDGFDHPVWGYAYSGNFWIALKDPNATPMPTFWVDCVGGTFNGDLDECERYLWDHFARDEWQELLAERS